MNKNYVILFLITALLFSKVYAVNVYFFHSTGCPHCARVINSGILNEIEKEYNLSIERYDVSQSNEGYMKYLYYVKNYNMPEGVPLVVINCSNKISYVIGDIPIINQLNETILKCENITFVKNGPTSTTNPYNKLTIPVVLVAALIDSINPCAFAVMIFLLSYMMSISSKKRLLKTGIAYIVAVYITYFLVGLGIFKSIQTFTQITFYIYIAAAIIAIIGGIINIKDFFFYGKGVSLAIPKSKKATIQKFVKKATLPSALILGFLVSLFELPCTGGVYLAILSLLAKSSVNGILYLLIYNLIFVFPLMIILVLIYGGIKAEKLEKWRENKRNWMRLIGGIFMLILGLGMILGWF